MPHRQGGDRHCHSTVAALSHSRVHHTYTQITQHTPAHMHQFAGRRLECAFRLRCIWVLRVCIFVSDVRANTAQSRSIGTPHRSSMDAACIGLLGAGGVGAGLMVGISKTNNVIVLNNQDAVCVDLSLCASCLSVSCVPLYVCAAKFACNMRPTSSQIDVFAGKGQVLYPTPRLAATLHVLPCRAATCHAAQAGRGCGDHSGSCGSRCRGRAPGFVSLYFYLNPRVA